MLRHLSKALTHKSQQGEEKKMLLISQLVADTDSLHFSDKAKKRTLIIFSISSFPKSLPCKNQGKHSFTNNLRAYFCFLGAVIIPHIHKFIHFPSHIQDWVTEEGLSVILFPGHIPVPAGPSTSTPSVFWVCPWVSSHQTCP